MTVRTHDLGQLVSFEEVFVERTYELGQIPFSPSVIIDCGAHVGYFSALAGATHAAVPLVVFEPNPDNLPSLRRNLAPLADRAVIHEAAVSSWDGTSSFAADWSNTGRMNVPGVSSVEIQVRDLASYLPRDPAARLLLKIDIEGEETRLLPHVLPGLPHRCALFLETHDGPAASETTVRLLEDAGFRVTRVRERASFTDLFALRNAG